jgi:tetratricopeptide (TPR) repeat protein
LLLFERFGANLRDFRLVFQLLLTPAMNDATKKSPIPQAVSPDQDTEKMLLQRLEATTNEEDRFRWMLFTVGYYRGIERAEAAKDLLRRFLSTTSNPEYHVQCRLALGQIATDEQQMDNAIGHFGAALELQPGSKKIEYILRNNLGYCLNMAGRYVEGEQHCRAALELNWTRPSAYRNLGISFHGQGKIASAAWALVEAVKMDPTDDRARLLLKKLATDHPSLVQQCPWLLTGLDPTALAAKQETTSG